MLVNYFKLCCMCVGFVAVGFCLDMKSYISGLGTWSGCKVHIIFAYSVALHCSGHEQP